MTYRPTRGRYGFAFHDACWCLLRKIYYGKPIPLERLIEVCRSPPFQPGEMLLQWNHDYGGLVRSIWWDGFAHPWKRQQKLIPSATSGRLHARLNPYEGPDFDMEDVHNCPPSGVSISNVAESDCFVKLPFELLLVIAVYLPTDDFLRLRQASKCFYYVFDSQTFWASRFAVNADRDFLFEMWGQKGPRDWRALYHSTKGCNSPRMANRKRIWNLGRSLKEKASLRWIGTTNLHRGDEGFSNIRWKRVTRENLLDHGHDLFSPIFSPPRSILRKNRVSIPDHLSRIAISTVPDGDVEYVCGMRFIHEDGTYLGLGYQAIGREFFVDATSLNGFVVAVGAKGIHGLRVITDSEHPSQWIGSSENLPKTQWPSHYGPLTAIAANFDVSIIFSGCSPLFRHWLRICGLANAVTEI